MQSERQHIDEFFRRKEEAFEADISRLTAHWQQLQTQLGGPGPRSKGKGFRFGSGSRRGRNLAGILITAAVVLLVLVFSKREKRATAKKTPPKQFVPAPAPAASDAPRSNTATIPTAKPIVIYEPRIRLNTTPVQKAIQPTTNRDTAATARTHPRPDAAALLDQFYTQIKKESQEFIVATDRQTVITGKEGTELTIPAFAFSGKNGLIKNGTVKIVMTEFYRYDDIISAKLSTMSGDEQLITGGMIHIAAEANGEQVNVASGKTIELKMPTDNYDEKMQLFTGGPEPAIRRTWQQGHDTLPQFNRTISYRNRLDDSGVDWKPAGQEQWMFSEGGNNIRVLNLAATPYRVTHRKKTTAKFYISEDLKIPVKELKEKLYDYYGTYYDKIKLVPSRSRNIFRVVDAEFRAEWKNIIDSVALDFREASAARLVSGVDSVRYFDRLRKDSIQRAERLKALKNYHFEISTLGWINCDRFASDPRPKLDLTIDLGEGYEAGKFVSHLIFTRYQGITNGFYHENKIQFRNIPENEPVYLVSVGVKDSKVVSCIRPLTASREEISNPGFVETTPEAFRAKMEELTNQLKGNTRN